MNERKLRFYGPLFLFAFLLVFFYAMFIKGFQTAVTFIVISAFYALLAWESTVRLIHVSRKKQPGIHRTRNRLIWLATYGLLVMFAVAFVDHLFSYLIGTYRSISLDDYAFLAGLNIMCSVIVIAIYEGIYYIHNWKALYEESEEIKKINLKNQFKLLKEQVKPHFLFNSLNTLAALIQSDSQSAERFVEQLSSVYRYLLRKNLRELATVREELRFIETYVAMLKTRFQDSLLVSISVPEDCQEHMVPPFVLQLLVENAVKHNIVSSDNPLEISIGMDGERLVVWNKLQRKSSSEASEQTGLLNLMERYRLLKKDHLLDILEENGGFVVALPLVKAPVTADV